MSPGARLASLTLASQERFLRRFPEILTQATARTPKSVSRASKVNLLGQGEECRGGALALGGGGGRTKFCRVGEMQKRHPGASALQENEVRGRKEAPPDAGAGRSPRVRGGLRVPAPPAPGCPASPRRCAAWR